MDRPSANCSNNATGQTQPAAPAATAHQPTKASACSTPKPISAALRLSHSISRPASAAASKPVSEATRSNRPMAAWLQPWSTRNGLIIRVPKPSPTL